MASTMNDLLSGIRLEAFTNEELDLIHHTTLDILERVGIRTDDPEALDYYEGAGCSVDRKTNTVYIPGYLVEEAIRSTPKNVKLYGVDKKKDIVAKASDSNVHWSPFGVGFQMFDYDPSGNHSVHDATEADLVNSMTILDYCDSIDRADTPITVTDIAGKGHCDIHELFIGLTNTTKPFSLGASEYENFDTYLEMNKMVYGGDEELAAKRPIFFSCCCQTSPLESPTRDSQLIIKCAENNITNEVISMVMAGSTGPVTLEGTIVTHNAEVLAGLVLAQIVNKGAPAFYSSATTMMDLKNGVAATGSPEMGLLGLSFGKLARHYGMPSGIIAGCWTDSKLPDVQAGFEKAMTAMLPAFGGATTVFGAGGIESGNTMSLEQLVIDNDIIAMTQRLLNGFNVNRESLAFDDITKVGPGKHFLAVKSTRMGMDSQSSPAIFDRRMRGDWVNNGAKDALEVANEKVQDILKTHNPCGLDADIVADLKALVAEKDKSYVQNA
ncbi:[trimethylamine--corrinoid protein] Co-methyltransferase [Methanococcoides methylutens]|uniref:[trimethylamine--corrinoid protein] Co-methyltransferase n=1 Tax=Methanococcoides methylutens TaxID=2226 RepID=UPI004044F302